MLFRVLKFRPDDGGSGGGSGDSSTITVTVDGKEVTVPRPKGLVTEEEFSTRFSKELARRSASIGTKAIDDLFANADEFAKLAEKKGFKIADASATRGDEGKPKPEVLAELRKTVEKELVHPLSEKMKATETKLAHMRERSLVADILAMAADLGIHDTLRKAKVAGTQPPIVAMLRENFAFDEESQQWFVKKGEGFAFSSKPTDESPYKTVAEFMQELGADKDFAEFIGKSSGQSGPGAKPGSQGRAKGGTIEISSADASIRSKWDAAHKEAEARGAKVVIIG